MPQLFGHFTHYFFILFFVVIFVARTGMWRRGGFFASRLFPAIKNHNTPVHPSDSARPPKQGETDLPQSVLNRITQEEAQSKLWTSGLSVNDWLLSKCYKMQPLRLVLGTSYFQNGFLNSYMPTYISLAKWNPWNIPCIPAANCRTALTKRSTITGRKCRGCRMYMHTKIEDLFSHQVECTFTGTAVTTPGLPESDLPILCAISMPEFIKLMECGSIPVSLSIGAGVYYENQSIHKILRGLNYKNQEMSDCTRVTSAAKHIAMTQLQADTKRLKADGCITHKSHHFVCAIRSQGNDDNNNICGFAIHFK